MFLNNNTQNTKNIFYSANPLLKKCILLRSEQEWPIILSTDKMMFTQMATLYKF